MTRFFRHPLHRAAVIVLIGAALLGYFVPAFIMRPGLWNGAMLGVSGLALLVYAGWSWRRRAERRDEAEH